MLLLVGSGEEGATEAATGVRAGTVGPTVDRMLQKREGADIKRRNDLNVGFPGGAVVTNPPANAGDTGSSSGPGRCHMPRSKARAPQLLSLRSTTPEAHAPRAGAPQQKKPPQ